jgi:translation initiation factor 2B subunit (eIF-2B alpha/beta/delta family)
MKKRNKKGISRFDKIVKDIKDVKIQGATAIAKSAIRAYNLKPTKEAYKKILSTRPTEPLMQNALKFISKSKNPRKASMKLLAYLNKSHKIIAKKGANLIKKNMNVFSHCHSSTVIDILKYAKKKRKKTFIVYTTEVEPLFQGSKTAKELAQYGINVIIMPDLAAEQALKNCDIFLFGVDAFTKKGIANKIGTSILCKIAKEHNIPRYVCGSSLKLTKKIKFEKRSPSEVWVNKSRKIEVINPAFDFTKKSLLSSVVSEFGVLSYSTFIKKAKLKLKKFN